MAKRVNIIYLSFRNLKYPYSLCENRIHKPSDRDIIFKSFAELIAYLGNSFNNKYQRRVLEFAVDKELPLEEKKNLSEFVKKNFPKAKIINY